MALVERIERIRKERPSIHKPTRCGCLVFTGADGETYLQLDTYGSEDRELAGKVSQTLQFDAKSAAQLSRALIEEAFPR